MAWDRDPLMLRLALSAADHGAALQSGRLRPALGVDLLDLRDQAPLDAWTAVRHPLLGQIYHGEWDLLQAGSAPDAPRALLCEGGLFVEDLRDALTARGYAVYTADAERLAVEELEQLARRFAPELVLTINYRTGLAELCERLGLPLISWEIDPTVDRIAPCAVSPTRARVYTYRRAQVPAFEAAGFSRVAYLPLAANPQRRTPVALSSEERTRYEAPLCFVGESMVEPAARFRQQLLQAFVALRGGADDALAQGELLLEGILAEQRADYARFVLRELVAERLGELAAAVAAQGEGNADDLVMLVAEIAAAEKRLSYVASLARLGLRVWGDAGWRAVEPHGVTYMGPAGHLHELNKVYCGARINIDIGRIYQSDIVTMRVFDVLACGGFIIAEQSEALDELLEVGQEVEVYRTLDELCDKVEHYQAHPEQAAAIAKRGMARVRRDHTIARRLETMLTGVA